MFESIIGTVPYLDNLWVQAGIVLLLFVITEKVIAFILKRYLIKFAKKTETKLDDILIERAEPTLLWVFLLWGLHISLKIAQVSQVWVFQIIQTLIAMILTMFFIIITVALIEDWGKRFARKTKSDVDDALLPLIRSFSKVFIIAIGALAILKVWHIEIGPFLAGLGVAGIAVAFALQTTLGNIFGGISLILDKNFKVGDWIKLDSGEVGQVIDIGIRSTKLQTPHNELLVVPNGNLANVTLYNYALPTKKARVIMTFGVAYGSDIKKVKKILLDSLNIIKEDLDQKEEPICRFMQMADFSLNFDLIFYLTDYSRKYPDIDIINEKVYNELNKHKIEIPFPTSTVHVIK